jgi:kinesin family protein C2/C3
VHRDEMNSIKKELEKAVTNAKTYAAELETLEKTLQATTAEAVALREENKNLNIALENVKRDHDALVQELEDVNARFDEVREEAERSGYDAAAEEIRAESIAAHEKELAEIVETMKDLAMANAGLQRSVDIVETALAAERDKQVDHVANSMSGEVEEKLKNQLARTKEELATRTQEVENLKSAFEGRVAKAEEDVCRLEKDLSTTRGKLAEAEANLIVIRREKKRDAATIPQQKAKVKARSPVATSRKVAKSFSNVTEESRDDVGPLSSFGEPHSLSRRLQSSTRKKRSRSTSPTTPQRLEYRMSEEANKSKTLQEQYESLKDQNRMNEAHMKRLEEDLKALQSQLFSNGGDTAVATQMSRISKLVSPRKGGDEFGDVRDVGTDVVEDVIKSGDTNRISEELRKLDKKSAMQREHNAQLLGKILSLQGNIQVCCRVRPLRMSEVQQGNKSVVEAFSESEIGCFDARANKWKSFGFDRVWGPDQSQQDVFQDVEPLALSVVDGYNACIFAYGQT